MSVRSTTINLTVSDHHGNTATPEAGSEQVEHPPYSSDLAIGDYQEHLYGKRLDVICAMNQ